MFSSIGLTSKRASPAGQAFESTSRISGQRNIGISRQARVGVRMPLLKNISSDTHRVGNQQGDDPGQTLPLPHLSSSHPGHQVSSCRVKQFSPPRHSPEICADRQCFHRAPVLIQRDILSRIHRSKIICLFIAPKSSRCPPW